MDTFRFEMQRFAERQSHVEGRFDEREGRRLTDTILFLIAGFRTESPPSC